MNGLPASRAASRSSSRRSRSPLGSTTIAPMPCSIARTAIQVIVTVLPEPVAPTTSVCVPPVAPPSGIVTARPFLLTTDDQPTAAKPVLRGDRAAERSSSLRASQRMRVQRAPSPRRRDRPGRRPPRCLRGASAARARLRRAPPCPVSRPRHRRGPDRASTTSTNAVAAQVQRRCRLRITRAAISPIAMPSARCTVAP